MSDVKIWICRKLVKVGGIEQQSEERAIRTAKALATKHAGVIAWSREARPDIDEYGELTVLFQAGEVPDQE